MIFLTEVIESGLFKGMTEQDAIATIAMCIFVLLMILIPFAFWIKCKIDDMFYKTYQPKDYEIEYDNFLAFPCPCCRSNNVQMIVTVKFDLIKSYKKEITFYEKETKLNYKIKCKDCGIQTESNEDLNKTILDWNGKSQSTELIKEEN